MAGEGGTKPGAVQVSLNITVEASQVANVMSLMRGHIDRLPFNKFVEFDEIHDVNVTEERL